MKKHLSILPFLLLGVLLLNAQSKQDYNWPLGYDRNLDLPGIEANMISFHNGERSIEEENLGCQMGSVHAVISDEEGNLLFYINGCVVVDSTHNIMMNGDEINAGFVHDVQCETGGYSGSVDSQILPDPNNKDGYYLIQKRVEYIYEPPQTFVIEPGLQYSYIDMTGNNGLGEVVQKNVSFFDADWAIVAGYVEAIKHENQSDWWIIQHEQETNKYYKVLVDKSGIAVVDSQRIGPVLDSNASATGDAVFTPDGAKYLFYNPNDDLLVYDFDRETGIISNLQQVTVDDDGIFTGVAVSPNSRFAYLSSSLDLWQVDLEAEILQESLTHIAHYDGFLDPFPTNFHLAQLAPDCKIYICSTNSTRFLHVINKPDESGKACDFQQHSLELIWENGTGSIPNFPNFRIDEEDVCDPTITSVFNFPVSIKNDIKVYPNPASHEIQLDNMGDFESVELISISGLPVLQIEINNQDNFSIQLPEHVTSGIYFMRFISKDRQSVMKKLVVTR